MINKYNAGDIVRRKRRKNNGFTLLLLDCDSCAYTYLWLENGGIDRMDISNLDTFYEKVA